MTSLKNRTVVITGASSGIGRPAALAFAEQGANVVVGARRIELLEEVAEACRALGVQALAIQTDVTIPSEMERLAEAADTHFGGVDVWINNAGTGVFGLYVEADVELHRKTIEVNLLGAVHGAAAVLPIFTRQNRGVLINNISLGGWAPTPYAAAYTASKFGLRGLTASLRQEFSDRKNIHVCGVFPAIVDTPGFAHGANVSDKSLNPGWHLYTPDDVAQTFIRVALRPRAETAVGWPARAAQLTFMTARGPMEHVSAAVFRGLLKLGKPAPRTDGAVLNPIDEGASERGGWLEKNRTPPAKVVNRIGGGVVLAAVALAGYQAVRSRRAARRGELRPADA